MDRSWMYDRVNSNRFGLKDSFLSGVEEFVNKTMEQPQFLNHGVIRCPCVNCKCIDLKTPREVKHHLYKYGFLPNYYIWTEHGEEDQDVDLGGHFSGGEDVGVEDQFEAMNEMINDAFRPLSNVLNVNANMENETPSDSEVPNEKAQQFYNKLISANQPIYEGAAESKLSISVKLLAAMSNWHVPQKCIDHFAQMLVDVCPTKQCLLQNHYQATKLVSTLGLEVEKIDCCTNGCLLYYKEDIHLTECRVCQAPRYVPRRKGMGNHKDVPQKRMFYFPIIPRLQRLYASKESASQMRWHRNNISNPNILRHPSDGKAWKHFDEVYPDFALESRNVRLGLCSDGFTPYTQASSSPYSCWPIIVTPYNLPPEMCMTKPYMFLTCLVPGPSNPKAKIDVYLQPLIDDLQRLWKDGILTYDISSKENFVMRAYLMWTINDFPAYGMLSGWMTQGKLACPYCMKDTKAFTLECGGKNSWFDCHRRFLPTNHSFRRSKRSFRKNNDEKDGPPKMLSGNDVWEAVCDYPKVTDVGWGTKILGYGKFRNWTKRSIFWDLPYWKDNLLRHNLDVMHIEKNFFDNVFNTVMNVTGKTKDNDKARKDLAKLCVRGDLEMQPLPNGKLAKPKATYSLTSEEAKLVCKWIKELKMPDGYASNLSRCADVTKGKLTGMKSHECHIFMECLLPIAFRSLPTEIWKPLTELSCFFKDLCCNTLKLEDLVRMEKNIAIIICKLERIFPPGSFDSMEHIPIHLPNEAILGGPVQYRWMYPFERLMGDSKRSVKNKARVEGSICTSYLHRETTYFCSHYFKTFNLLTSTSLRNNPQSNHENVQPTLSLLSKCGRPSGKPKVYWLLDEEWKSAHVHVLINCDEVKPYLEAFLHYHSTDEQDASSLIHDEFPNWLKAYVQDERNGTINPYVKALSWGPCSKATSWHMYFVNGYKFHTQDWSHGKKTTNCGVHVKGLTNGGEDDDYGIIQNILQLEYNDFGDKITLFHCEWFDPTKNSGTRVQKQYNIVDIKMNKRYRQYDPFLLAQKARQTTTSEAFRFIPTPGFTLSRQFQQGPPEHTTHDIERDHRHQEDDQEHEERNQEVDEEGEIEEDGEEDNHDKDTCGKVIIRPMCNGFTPADVAAAAIRRVIEKTFPDNITCYSEVKDKARELWFKNFGARKKDKKPEWMNEEGWKYLTGRWKEDEFKTRSERNKTNRASSKGGALHTTGRKAHHDIALDMNAMLGRPVHPDELFMATHKKRNGEWVDRRSEKTHNDYQQRMTQATQTDDGVTSVTQEVDGSEKIQIWKDVSGGKSRGRCYGVGHLAPNLRYGVTHLTDEADAHHIRVENQKIEAARAEAARARADAEAAKADATAARADAAAANANYKSLETKFEEFQRRMMALESGSCSGHSRQSSHPHYDNELDDQSVDEEEDDGL
ncbi:hypothetical protein QL285_070997 [Trifolium repens]|nr:hypothetical protein QL285_070997 [Trifolium repens]